MSVAELRSWSLERGRGKRRQRELHDAIDRCMVLWPDDETATAWSRINAHRRRIGRPILAGDCWIAATALRHGIPLITHNAADYDEIEGLNLITRAR